ncbi:MAG: hypothetical protein H7123_02835 [Thermoleophilia bacterium]|nr:hypothetical protein [Thermoleophilia bacterium]
MPRLQTSVREIPRSGKIIIVWNPQGAGSPNIPANRPEAYFPGDGFVDVVANDLYDLPKTGAYWRGMTEMYTRYSSKPYMVAEWGPLHHESPAFVRQMFAWVKHHPRTVALSYWGSGVGARSGQQPKSYREYRRQVARLLPRQPGQPLEYQACATAHATPLYLWQSDCAARWDRSEVTWSGMHVDYGGALHMTYLLRDGTQLVVVHAPGAERVTEQANYTRPGCAPIILPDGRIVSLKPNKLVPCDWATDVARASVLVTRLPASFSCSPTSVSPTRDSTCSDPYDARVDLSVWSAARVNELDVLRARSLARECGGSLIVEGRTTRGATAAVSEGVKCADGRLVAQTFARWRSTFDRFLEAPPLPVVSGWTCTATGLPFSSSVRCRPAAGTGCVLVDDWPSTFTAVTTPFGQLLVPKDGAVTDPCSLL